MNERRRWLLANAMVVAHKKANKKVQHCNRLIGTSKQASRKAIALIKLTAKI